MINSSLKHLQKAYIHGLLFLIILGTLGCTGASHHSIENFPIEPLFESQEVAQLTSDEQRIARSLLHALVEQKKGEAEARGIRHTYYIRLLGKNPDTGILAGLDDERVKLKPASEGMQRAGIVYHSEGEWSELYGINRINIDGDTARVEVSFYSTPISGIGYEHRLIRKDGTWEMVDTKFLWIS